MAKYGNAWADKLHDKGLLKPGQLPLVENRGGVNANPPTPRPNVTVEGAEKRAKYGNRRVSGDERADGEAFDSRLEARVHDDLVARYGRERVIRQPSLPAVAGSRVRLRPDFLVIHGVVEAQEGDRIVIELIDAKGKQAKDWRGKAKMFCESRRLPLTIAKRSRNGLVYEPFG